MVTNSAIGKLERCLNQLENAERLLGQLPKAYYKNDNDLKQITTLQMNIRNIRKTIEEIKRLRTHS